MGIFNLKQPVSSLLQNKIALVSLDYSTKYKVKQKMLVRPLGVHVFYYR